MVDLRCEEFSVVLAGNLALEVLSRQLELVTLWCLLAQLLGLLLEQLECVVLGHGLALSGLDTVLCPLPELRPRYLGGSSVLHEEVDGHTSDTTDPGLHVTETDVEVLADTSLGDLSGHVHVKQVVGGDVDIFTADVHLVGCGHVLVEDVGGDLSERRVSNPGTIVAGAHLAELVRLDLGHGGVVGLLVVLDGNLCGHTTHGVDTSLVASLDEELDVCVHEGRGHGDGIAVGENEVGVLAEALDGVEDVVPAAAVQAGRVVTKLVDDLVVISSWSSS